MATLEEMFVVLASSSKRPVLSIVDIRRPYILHSDMPIPYSVVFPDHLRAGRLYTAPPVMMKPASDAAPFVPPILRASVDQHVHATGIGSRRR